MRLSKIWAPQNHPICGNVFNGKTMVLIDPPFSETWPQVGPLSGTFSTNISTALCFREALMVATASTAVSGH